MRGKILILGAAACMLAGFANAAVSWTYNFGETASTVGTGLANQTPNVDNGVYTAGSTSGLYGAFGSGNVNRSITVYAVQETITPGTGHNNENTSTGTLSAANTSTLNGLFQVDDHWNNNGVGIAPYDPTNDTSLAAAQANHFANQNGISDDTGGAGTSNLQNLLLINLGTVNANETLTFLMQAGVTGDSFNVWTYYGTDTPTQLATSSGLGKMTEYAASVAVGGTQPTTPQVSFSTLNNGGQNLWVAIQADCHYLLLDQIGVSYTPTPEPRFYGMLLVGFLALGAGMRRRFARQV